jgi:hypothetical protein
MGRPPIGEQAMTAAEKQRRYRERKFGNKAAVSKPTTAQAQRQQAEIAALKLEIARLRAQPVEPAKAAAAKPAPVANRQALPTAAPEQVRQLAGENKALRDRFIQQLEQALRNGSVSQPTPTWGTESEANEANLIRMFDFAWSRMEFYEAWAVYHEMRGAYLKGRLVGGRAAGEDEATDR